MAVADLVVFAACFAARGSLIGRTGVAVCLAVAAQIVVALGIPVAGRESPLERF